MNWIKSLGLFIFLMAGVIVVEFLGSQTDSLGVASVISIFLYGILFLIISAFFELGLPTFECKNLKKSDLRLVVMYFSLFTVFYYIFNWTGYIEQEVNDNTNTTRLLSYYLLLPLSLFVNAFVEEYFFRQVILLDFLSAEKKAYKMIFVSILFSAGHLPEDLFTGLHLFIASAIYCYITLVSGNMKSAFLIHFTHNFLLLLYCVHNDPAMDSYSSLILVENYTFFPGMSSIVLMVLLTEIAILIYFINQRKKTGTV